ncbi:MAG: hypothetical protein KC486_00760, partial [Myxococcales bacterium]|nr:hypothetical protein [Myxococcales bacterium]
MPILRPFERLVTRLVYRDAANAYGAVVLAVAFAAVFVGRAWPPPQIREALVGAEVGTRAAILAGALAAYLLATRAAMRLLLGSARLAYLRHLPVARGRWRRLHLAHLVAVNLPWAAVVAYGLAGPPSADGLGPLGRGFVGSCWVAITLAAQVDAVYAARAGRRLLGFSAAIAGGAGLIFAATPTMMSTLAVLFGAGALVHLWRQLGGPPPERDGSVRRWFARRRGAGRRRPVVALLRVDGLALVRRGPASLRRHLGVVGGCVAIAVVAIVAAVNAGQTPDPGL